MAGTSLFHPIAAWFAPRLLGPGAFDPVVAGQYVRAPFDLEQLEFTFLAPPMRQAAEVRYSLTVSPRLIWDAMKSTSERLHTYFRHDTLAHRSEDHSSEWMHSFFKCDSLTHHDADFSRLLGRGESLVVNRSDSINDERRQSFHLERRMLVRNRIIPRQDTPHSMMPNGSLNGRSHGSPTELSHRSPIVFAPLSLLFTHAKASVTTPGWQSSMMNTSVAGAEANRPVPAPTRSASSPDLGFIVSPIVRRVALQYVRDSAPLRQAIANSHKSVRTAVTQTFGFGGIAAVGAARPADLVPVVYHTTHAHQKAGTAEHMYETTAVDGARLADGFASAVMERHTRSEYLPGSAGVAASVPLIVRATPLGDGGPSENSRREQTALKNELPPNHPTPMNGLPADLMQQLTEQVVRSIEARALALRERFGRF